VVSSSFARAQSARLDPLRTPSLNFLTALQAAFRTSTASGRMARTTASRRPRRPH